MLNSSKVATLITSTRPKHLRVGAHSIHFHQASAMFLLGERKVLKPHSHWTRGTLAASLRPKLDLWYP
ncbi:Hypp2379 [Branchiostoma lanceolatum]|uniref:Hypp2379 protein n=1 Tax=Branchiostoma lanceolatum TaxID=7740 RepID=A0A8K0EPJ6_BRALA|nr:Hypp2379 [Branchiostoma lanceolatum]